MILECVRKRNLHLRIQMSEPEIGFDFLLFNFKFTPINRKCTLHNGLWTSMQEDSELTAVVRSRQLHIYRNGKKVLILAGKAAPKVIIENNKQINRD